MAKIVQGERNSKKQLADFLHCRAAACLDKERGWQFLKGICYFCEEIVLIWMRTGINVT